MCEDEETEEMTTEDYVRETLLRYYNFPPEQLVDDICNLIPEEEHDSCPAMWS